MRDARCEMRQLPDLLLTHIPTCPIGRHHSSDYFQAVGRGGEVYAR